jgi:MFS family permease
MLGVLREREFRLLWLGQSASTVGDRLVFVAIALYVTEIGTPTDVGLVLAAYTVSLVLCVMFGGVWADRLPRHRLMLATDVIRGGAHALLAVLIFTGTVEVWMIVAIEVVFGGAEAFFRPAMTGLVPQTVSEERVQEANSAISVVHTVAEFVGPALATALVLGVGAGWAFTLDALTFAVSAFFLARMRPRARGEVVAPSGSVLGELREGWGEFRSRAWVWGIVGIFSVMLLVALAPYYVLGPTIAETEYGDRAVYGTLAAALGLGTVTGALIGFRWRPGRPMFAGLVLSLGWPAAIMLFAVGLPVGVLFALFFAAGVGIALFDVWWHTALQQRIPPYALSRVSSYDWMGSLALLPVGYLLAGPLGETFGNAEVLLAGGAAALLLAVLGLAIPDVWRLRALPRAG